ncbi:phosphodiester glycosidase family protein [Bacillus sp. EB600]|uniref:phosphodiester glycosidase family protein n=1 Tax=Bacillus sp. EB600 TaxID=2806345 RepID=UPI002108BB9D|nr:phosphodiester glycosidase family protein [Bacillus sp. EB600]MCQ6282075.1 phosphodiester glycosidase family protein [Bacillus sp. EB600]
MDSITDNTAYGPRSRPKPKRGRFWRVFWISLLIILLIGGGWLYGTNQGLQFRRLLVGSVLSSQHPQYVKYMRFLLSKSEFDQLYSAFNNPSSEQTNINQEKIKRENTAEAAGLKSFSDSIIVDTVTTANYTAKILVIPDPTTVHVVATKYTSKGQALSELIKNNHGIAGINGGGFNDPHGNGSGGQMLGLIISNGKVLSTPGGSYTANALVGAFLKDGRFVTGSYSANELLKMGVKEAISFGPQLIVNGKNRVTPSVDGAWGWAPRTAIGQTVNGRVVMIITDGRFYWDKTHRGASMSDMVHLFQKYDVTNAIAMDGGGSTTMIKDRQLLLKPATNTDVGMRYLPDAWVVIPHN